MSRRIYYAKPSITELEVGYATDAARHGWGERCYEYIGRFEERFAMFAGARYAIATSSCTGALHMGLAAAGVGPGDEVILADINWIATAAPIAHLGAKPVFTDILPDTWCIDPVQAEAAITPRTKAIVATHLYGNLCELDRLLEIAARHRLALVEDAAEAIGSRWGGRHAGSHGLFGTFSFHGSKTLTTGEGGMLVTNDSALYETALTLSNHGRARRQVKQFWPDMIGFKYKMSNIQAAIGCAQLERIDELLARKRQIFRSYQEELGGIAELAMNPEKPGTVNGYWMPNVVFGTSHGFDRDAYLASVQAAGIDSRVFFPPLSSLGLFAAAPGGPVGNSVHSRAVNLPAFHDIDAAQIEVVCKHVRRFAAGGDA
jgi:perosamine synthetase